MIFSEITANDALISRLRKNIAAEKIAHAYIFEGTKRAEKMKIALGFVQEIFCFKLPSDDEKRSMCHRIEDGNHPDLLVISHEGIMIKDVELEKVQEKLMTAPMLADFNVIIIDGADSITVRAQNRILKTLEEPVTDSIIILLSENCYNLLPTVRSRCIKFHVNEASAIKSEETLKVEKLAREMMRDLQKKELFYKLMPKYEEYISLKKYALIMLETMELMLSENFEEFVNAGEIEAAASATDAIQKAEKDLKLGVKPAYAMKNLLIELEDII